MRRVQNSPTTPAMQGCDVRRAVEQLMHGATGRPTTFEYEPSIRGMKRDASPWMA